METKRKRTKVAVSLLALAGLAVFSLFAVGGSLEPGAPPGPTMKTLDDVEPRVAIHASDLPLTITEPNSYYLVENVNFTDDANHAITIECNDVTIDLMGYTLKGPDSGTKCGIYMGGRRNVEVRNGTVRDFYYGIREQSSAGRQHRVINVRAMSNEYYGIRLYGYGHVVKDCTAGDNSTYGIFVGYGSTVTDNTAYSNASNGISTVSGCTVTGNAAYNNQAEGIYTGYGCTVTGNSVCNNQNYGIYAGSGCTVTDNSAYSNQSNGIYTGTGSTVRGNTAYDNQGSGIAAGGATTVSANMAYYNQNSGIFVGYGSTVTGNTAYQNNQSDAASYAGIWVNSGCLVKGNTLNGNLQNNIYVSGTDNAIEENLVTQTNPGNGINLAGNGNFYANNRASGNGTDFANTGDDTDGGGNVPF